MSEYIITTEQIEELNRAHGGMQILTSWLSAYAIFDTSKFPPQMKSEHLAITLPNVVRCRDCKFSRKVEWPEWMNVPSDYLDCHGELVETWDYYNDEPNNNPVKPDGFCAWGEK